MDIISKIITQWRVEKISLNAPATFEEIRRAEEIIGYTFPADFKELYMKVDGFRDWDMSSNMFSVWPIQSIIEGYLEQVAAKADTSTYRQELAKNFISFCDYLMNSHQIGFFKDRNGVYKDYDEFNPIAETFTDAIELINSNSDTIY